MFSDVKDLDLFKDPMVSTLEPFMIVLIIGIASLLPAGNILDISQT